MIFRRPLGPGLDELKAGLAPGKKFGVDLLLPKVGDGARATNHDYTNGQLMELIDVIIEKGASLFVAAVGVPPPEVVRWQELGRSYLPSLASVDLGKPWIAKSLLEECHRKKYSVHLAEYHLSTCTNLA